MKDLNHSELCRWCLENGRYCGRRCRSLSSRRGVGNEEKNKKRKKKMDNTFEWSRTTGGRKEATEDGRWLCLCFLFVVNRGLGSNKLSRPSPLGDSLFMFD